MSNSLFPRSRREFLTDTLMGAGVVSMAGGAPLFMQQAMAQASLAQGGSDKILVIVQMSGGNDGLNTVIPHQDDDYHKRRPTMSIKSGDCFELDAYTGLNNGMKEFKELFDDGDLAVIRNVGYPKPNRSHFRATDIYQLGALKGKTGWIGRFLDEAYPNVAGQKLPVAINMGKSIPMTFAGARTHNVYSKIGADDALMETAAVKKSMLMEEDTLELLKASIERTTKVDNATAAYLGSSYADALVQKEKMDALMAGYKSSVEYKGGGLGQSLKNIAALISKDLPTRVYYAKTGGFDTHANQLGRHPKLLGNVSGAIGSFLADLKAKKLDDKVIVMTFTEFGRRIDENGSAGTDHGTLSPMFVAGTNVNGGLFGSENKKIADQGGDLKFDASKDPDFRQVYTTILEGWMGINSAKIFDKKYEPMSFV